MRDFRRRTGMVCEHAIMALVLLGIVALTWGTDEAIACPPPGCDISRIRILPALDTTNLKGVSVLPGFPRISATWSCCVPLFYDIDGDGRQEGLMPCAAECIGYGSTKVHRAYDSIWVFKEGGVNARHFPVTLKGHPCCPMAIGNIDSDQESEIVIGSDVNPAGGPRDPDSRVYAFNSDGTIVSGFPVDLGRGPICGGVCLTDLDGDPSRLEVLFGTKGWMADDGPHAGKIAALNGDGTIVAGWDKDLNASRVLGAPAVGDLIDLPDCPGPEVVFVVMHFVNDVGIYKYNTRVLIYKRDGTAIASLDLIDPSPSIGESTSSPAIGKILEYPSTPEVVSNFVVCTSGTDTTHGRLHIFHLERSGDSISIKEDWSFEASVQTDCGVGGLLPEIFLSDPVIADIDLDGQNEIVALSQLGTVYLVDRDGPFFKIASTVVIECGGALFNAASPLVCDLDDDHTDLEILVCAPALLSEENSYIRIYEYKKGPGVSSPLTEHPEIGPIGPFPTTIRGTPALGDLDGDNKTDLIVQPHGGGRIHCLEFDNSQYDSPANAVGWPFLGRTATRSHNADEVLTVERGKR